MQMTFTLGDAIQIGVTVAAVVLAYAAITERLRLMEVTFAPILSWWNGLAARAADKERR